MDDSSLCGSGTGSVVETIRGYLADRQQSSDAAGRLMVPDRVLAEVARHHVGSPALEISVLNTGGAGGLLGLNRRELPGLEIVAVESALRDLDDLAGNAARVVAAAEELGDMEIFVELPYTSGFGSAVEVVEAAGLSAKIIFAADPFGLAEQLSILIEADCSFKVQLRATDDLWPLSRTVEALIDGCSISEATAMLTEGGAEGSTETDRRRVENWDAPTTLRVARRLRRVAVDRLGRGGAR